MEVNIVESWLDNMGLGSLFQTFADNGYDHLETCKQIGDVDLDAMEIEGLETRVRLLEEVKTLKEQGATQVYIRAARRKEGRRTRRNNEENIVEYDRGVGGRRIPENLLHKILQFKLKNEGISLLQFPLNSKDASSCLQSLSSRYSSSLGTPLADVETALEVQWRDAWRNTEPRIQILDEAWRETDPHIQVLEEAWGVREPRIQVIEDHQYEDPIVSKKYSTLTRQADSICQAKLFSKSQSRYSRLTSPCTSRLDVSRSLESPAWTHGTPQCNRRLAPSTNRSPDVRTICGKDGYVAPAFDSSPDSSMSSTYSSSSSFLNSTSTSSTFSRKNNHNSDWWRCASDRGCEDMKVLGVAGLLSTLRLRNKRDLINHNDKRDNINHNNNDIKTTRPGGNSRRRIFAQEPMKIKRQEDLIIPFHFGEQERSYNSVL